MRSRTGRLRTQRADFARRGFTLLELMVVVVILGILAGVVAVSVSNKDDQAKVVVTRASIAAVEDAVETYKLSVQTYPTALTDLLAAPAGVKGWSGPYLRGRAGVPLDGWSRPILYRIPGTQGQPFDVYSLGADGAVGGEGFDADIVGAGS